ncbi:MAG: hypothetical protein KF810_17330 [Rhizobiaceae bacterium]|nr:hypothetical protein [Rhizobiaceae bacterium]
MTSPRINDVVDPNILPKAWQTVCNMENSLATIVDLASALALVSEAIDEASVSGAIQRVAWMIRDSANEAEELRGQLFHMTHANNRSRLATTRDEVSYATQGGKL